MARKNAVDREFAKIAAAAPPAQPAVSDVAVRPKTLAELTAEYEQAAQEGRSCAEALSILERELSDTRKRFEAACARRAAVWRAIEQIHGAAG